MIAKGGKLAESFTSVGYAKASAHSNATRLMGNDGMLSRIEELKTTIAAGVVDLEIRKRSARVRVLQNNLNRLLGLIEARAVMYGGQMGESRQVHDDPQEKRAIAEGYSEIDERGDVAANCSATYPKTMHHPGYPNGGATGMLVKDYRGKNAEQEIWKFDASLVAQINDVLKQAAIEEGQWNERRQLSSEVGISEITRRLNAGRDRCAAAKRAADEKAKRDAAAALSRPPAS